MKTITGSSLFLTMVVSFISKKLRMALLLAGLVSTSFQAKAWDFEYGFFGVFSSNALDHVVEQINIARHDEGIVSYWNPIANGSEARLTQKFSFPQPTARIFLNAHLSSYNFGGGNFASSSLLGSQDGTNWVQLLDVPTPTGILNTGDYQTNLPPSLIGGNEIWIQARLQSSGWNIMAQFLRHDVGDPNNVFSLNADFRKPVLSIETAAVRLRWLAASNVTYQVQWSTNFQTWSNLTSVVGTGAETNLVDWTDGPTKFYRLFQP